MARKQLDLGLPPGPNPALAKGLRVEPFASVWALVNGLGVVSIHRTEAAAQGALEDERERLARANLPREIDAPDGDEAAK